MNFFSFITINSFVAEKMPNSMAYFAVSIAAFLCVGVMLTCLMVFPKMYSDINLLHRDVISSVNEFKVNSFKSYISERFVCR